MLLELHVKNLAVLAGAGIELGPGFNVLSGETGAGKSIVVDGLSLLAGSRASSELIRTGAESLTVTGLFAPSGDGWRGLLAEAGVDAPGDEILVRREIHRNGRNRLYIDDQPTTLRTLSELSPHLLRIHGQREELGLTEPELQRRWLDLAGGAEAAALAGRVVAAHTAWSEIHERLERLTGDARAREERIDFLRFQAREIDAARPVAGEDDELRAERAVLRNSEQITRALGSSVESLFDDDGAATGRLARAEDALAEIEEWEPEATAWRSELEGARITIEEVARAMRGRLDHIEADPARLDQVEERLAVLERLARKYGGSAAAVLERRSEIAAELEELEGAEENREALEQRATGALEEFRRLALELSARRAAWGEELTHRVHQEIADLGLEKARLGVALERRREGSSPLEIDGEPVEFSAAGVDHVVFLFAPNPGEEPQPLARIASGGELSRLALGFQLALQRTHRPASSGEPGPTLVFDEVDTGISGAQAAALGRKLRRLADGAEGAGGGRAQILAVTHLPQVASFGHRHFRVEKVVADGRTVTSVVPLADDDRVAEVARMLAGERVTDLSLSHARELLDGAVAPAGT